MVDCKRTKMVLECHILSLRHGTIELVTVGGRENGKIRAYWLDLWICTPVWQERTIAETCAIYRKVNFNAWQSAE